MDCGVSRVEKRTSCGNRVRDRSLVPRPISPDGKTVCFPVRRQGALDSCIAWPPTAPARARRRVARCERRCVVVSRWKMDCRCRRRGKGARLFKIPVGGGSPVRLVDSVSSNPAWSPDGRFILYSGTPRARNAPVRRSHPMASHFHFHNFLSIATATAIDFLPMESSSS